MLKEVIEDINLSFPKRKIFFLLKKKYISIGKFSTLLCVIILHYSKISI